MISTVIIFLLLAALVYEKTTVVRQQKSIEALQDHIALVEQTLALARSGRGE